MKKNIKLNKNIIKALSIGISASMMLQPMTAFAGTATDAENANNNSEETTKTDAVTPAEELESKVETVESEKVAPAIDKVEEAVKLAEEINSDEAGLPQVSTDAIVAELGMQEKTVDGKEQLVSDAEDDVNQVVTDIEAIEDQDKVIVAEAKTANDAVQDAADANKAATDIQTAIEKEIKDAADKVADADEVVDGARSDIANAGSVDAANAAFDSAKSSVDEADEAVKKAAADFEKAETDFAQAESDYGTAEKAYNDTLELLAAAEEKYADLVDTAEGDAAIAQQELAALAAQAEALGNAAAQAKDKYDKAGFGYIAALEAKLQGKNPNFTSDLRELFKAIVKFYYIPEVENGTVTDIILHDEKGDKITYTTADGTVSGLTSKGDTYKYYEVKYTVGEGEDKEEKTLNLNYKTNKANQTNKFEGIVIFEKTAHTVYDGQDLSTDNIADLEAGKVVEFHDDLLVKDDDAYVGFNKEDGVVDETKNDVVAYDNVDAETGLGDQLVIDKEETIWSYDAENDTLTKTVKKDYTTTEFTGHTLEGQEATLADSATSKAQYVAELQNIIDNLEEGQSFEIAGETFTKGSVATDKGYSEITFDDVITETTGYTVTGTYQNKESKNFTYEGSGYFWGANDERDSDMMEAYKSGNLNSDYTREKKDAVLGIFGGHYEGELEIQGTEVHTDYKRTTGPLGGPRYEVYGTVEFQKVQSVSVDGYYAMLGWLVGNKSAEQRKADAIADIEAKGGTFIEFIAFDGNIGEGSILYIPGNAAEDTISVSDDVTDEASAKAAFEEKYSDKVNVQVTGATAVTKETTVTKYGYDPISYILKTVTETKGAEVAETVWNTIAKTSEVQYRNDNWYTGNILLAERNRETGVDYTTDKVETGKTESYTLNSEMEEKTAAFRKKVDDAAAVAQKYADLITKAEESKQAVEAAKSEVETIKGQIADLKANYSVDKLEGFSASLKAAEKALSDAETARDNLLAKLAEVETELGRRVAELTPAPAPAPSTEAEITEEAPAQAATPASTTPQGTVEEVAEETEDTEAEAETTEPEAVANTENRDIVDEGPALAAAPVSDKTIEDEDTALASMPEAQQMSWWWLLLILVLGTTGAEMYRRHMVKKNAAKAESTDNQ